MNVENTSFLDLKIRKRNILIAKYSAAIVAKLILGLFVYLPIILLETGVLRGFDYSKVGQFIELSALMFCIIVFAISTLDQFYRRKIRKEIESKTLPSDDEAAQKQRISFADVAPYIVILADALGVIAELIASIDDFIHFGFGTVHGNLPLNALTMCDVTLALVGIVLNLISLPSTISEYRKAKSNYDETNEESVKYFTKNRRNLYIAIASLVVTIIAVTGRTISGLEGTGYIAIGKDGDTIFPFGMLIRSTAVITGIIIAVIVIKILLGRNHGQRYQMNTKAVQCNEKDQLLQSDLAESIKNKSYVVDQTVVVSNSDNQEDDNDGKNLSPHYIKQNKIFDEFNKFVDQQVETIDQNMYYEIQPEVVVSLPEEVKEEGNEQTKDFLGKILDSNSMNASILEKNVENTLLQSSAVLHSKALRRRSMGDDSSQSFGERLISERNTAKEDLNSIKDLTNASKSVGRSLPTKSSNHWGSSPKFKRKSSV